MTPTGHLDTEACYRAVSSRDRRFDGVFYTAVRTTGIYCRPSCPARTPAPGNVTFHPTAASAHAAGFRACKRCLPDATPGSPEWDVAADVAGRAMRLIADGLVDREGVDGLARRVGYTPRHLGRLLTQELGAGPLALARARRAQSARVLIETTDLPLTDVAFAAGFASVRQFNETAARDLRVLAQRAARSSYGRPQRRRRHDAAARPHAVRRAADARLPRLPPRAGRRGRRTRLVRPHARPAPRQRHRAPRAGRPPRHVRPSGRRDRLRHRRVPARGPARHRGRQRARTPPARRRLRPARGGRRTSLPTRCSATSSAPPRDCVSPDRSTATRRRSAR